MYKKCYAEYKSYNKYLIHLWTDNDYTTTEWSAPAYIECDESEAKYRGLNDEPLKKIYKWKQDMDGLHFHDMSPYQNFLIEKYGTNDELSVNHKEIFFDIEIEMGDALTPEYIQSAPKKVTSIAWYYKQKDEWKIIILDPKQQIQPTTNENKEIIPVYNEEVLLSKFLSHMRELDPDILIGYNSDYFDIPYLYYRIEKVLGKEMVEYLSPIQIVKEKRSFRTGEIYDVKQPIEIAGVESLDYMRLHQKYSWEDEPSWKLDALGEKYAGLNKIEYDGSLDRLFEEDIEKFIEYNFRDVEILVELDKKLEYLALTKNLSHKGKHNYSEVYHNTVTQDGAISAYLLSQDIIPPRKEPNPKKKQGYAGGYLFCPKAGVYKYMFDEDLTSLYPCIIMSLNIGKETMVGRIICNELPENLNYRPYQDQDGMPIPSRNNRLGLNDLKEKDPEEELIIKNAKDKPAKIKVGNLINLIEDMELAVSANGTFFRTDKQSVLSIILNKWFDERVKYKNQMKKAYKAGNSELGASFHLKQYTMKILLNSLYGATALPTFRYAMNEAILSEAITLSGWRIIQESALTANRHINKLIKNNNDSYSTID